jgi:hypothetical protein
MLSPSQILSDYFALINRIQNVVIFFLVLTSVICMGGIVGLAAYLDKWSLCGLAVVPAFFAFLLVLKVRRISDGLLSFQHVFGYVLPDIGVEKARLVPDIPEVPAVRETARAAVARAEAEARSRYDGAIDSLASAIVQTYSTPITLGFMLGTTCVAVGITLSQVDGVPLWAVITLAVVGALVLAAALAAWCVLRTIAAVTVAAVRSAADSYVDRYIEGAKETALEHIAKGETKVVDE